MTYASWLHSFLSSPNCFSISKRLRRFGLDIKIFLRGIKARKAEAKESFQKEKKTWINSLKQVEDIEEILRYRFRNPKLLHQAFTHSTYGEHYESYERLEYVGDSVLHLLITKHQFSTYPDLSPEKLSLVVAANIDNEKLARVAIKHNLYKYILHRNPNFDKRVQEFMAALPRYPLHSYGMLNSPKVLADVVESTIAAIFVDSNSSIDMTWQVMKPLFEPIITPDKLEKNPVTKLLEMCHKNKLKVRFEDLGFKKGAFIYEAFINDQQKGRCRNPSKKVALCGAANLAYKEVVKTRVVRLP